MKAIVTRVSSASVEIDGAVHGKIAQGYLVLLGIAPQDSPETVQTLSEKICNLRVFSDENGKMNLNLQQVGGSLLVISQFTLFADTSSRRPSFSKGAAKPELAKALYEAFVEACKAKGFTVETGIFAADMKVSSCNDGPVTICYDTETD